MANNFITNNKDQHKTLKTRINTLISISDELKFLVGFFYFSGWEEVYKALKSNPQIKLKLLIGLQVDKMLSKVVEHAVQDNNMSQDEQFQRFMTSLGFAINNDEMDTEAFYNQVVFFLEMLEEGRLIIRKTENSNHAKLYLFKLNEFQAGLQDMKGQFITGSSNLTKAGLSGQEEFNVEIKDYGFEDAETYFDSLWENAIPLTEIDDRRKFLTEFVQHKSQAAIITPYEAYALILKTYLDLQQQKLIKPQVEELLEKNNFKKFSYQIDAVNQALSIIKEYNGVIIGDVVGLGKSVIAAMIAKNMGERGMVICPPGLIGNKTYNTGWWGYINNFKLFDWEVESRGKLNELAENIHNKDINVVIVDEAHYFRNQDTEDYEALMNICRGKTVILLTATPFNNSPADIFSLLKLFIVPGKSGITIEDNLEGLFRTYNYRFRRLSDILKNGFSKNDKKRIKAERAYIQMFGTALPVDLQKVRLETKRLSSQIKTVIAPVLIRRNRLDLKSDFVYANEIDTLSEIKDPVELFYHLNEEQSLFYDEIIDKYFGEDGQFSGAIYQPFMYEKLIEDEDKLDEAGNRAFIQQRNLYDFMRRLLVKRFESSFGAFSKSIDRFLSVHKLVKNFIKQSGGRYIMDRDLIDKIQAYNEDAIIEILYKYENDLLEKKIPKNNTVYLIDDFQLKDKFLDDIESDIALFEKIRDKIDALNLVMTDPKRERVYNEIVRMHKKYGTERKIIIFSEYVNTVEHLEPFFREKFGNRLLVCDGSLSQEMSRKIITDFDAQYKGSKTNFFDILITSDKLSEGYNLNRAGTIINYDIPWNPTRVIQRVGRINRIGTKVFDNLYIFNFFPSEQGADIVKSKEIASQKMFLIHNALGEDSKMFEPDEEPTASMLFKKVNQNPDEEGEMGTPTIIRNKFNEICKEHPEVIEKISTFPPRVKTAKPFHKNTLSVLRKKGLGLFAQVIIDPSNDKNIIDEIPFEELLPFVECKFHEPRLALSPVFWPAYEAVKQHKLTHKASKSEQDLSIKAHNNLKVALKLSNPSDAGLYEFIKTLILDIRKYHTLSSRTLGRLGRKELKESSNESVKKSFFDEIKWIMNHFGHDYLEKILKRIENQESEVIISVENII